MKVVTFLFMSTSLILVAIYAATIPTFASWQLKIPVSNLYSKIEKYLEWVYGLLPNPSSSNDISPTTFCLMPFSPKLAQLRRVRFTGAG